MRVENMEGGVLDLWVALALGEKRSTKHEATNECGLYWLKQGDYGSVKLCPRYSTRPGDGQPIIESEYISTLYLESFGEWRASHRLMRGNKSVCGNTALQAAMRAFVAARFGDNVQLDTEDEPT